MALTAAAINESSSESITLSQYRTLVVLAGNPRATAGEVADELGVSPPAVTRLVRTLARRHLVTRKVDERDRRQVRLELTRAGAELVSSVTQLRGRQFRRAIAPLSAAQRAMLLRSLEQLMSGLEPARR